MEQRLLLLMQSNVISGQSYRATLNALPLLAEHFGAEEECQQYQMLVTHMARAADRILDDQQIEAGLDEEIWQEIIEDEQYGLLSALNSELLALYGISKAGHAETSFLISNLFSLHCATQQEAQPC